MTSTDKICKDIISGLQEWHISDHIKVPVYYLYNYYPKGITVNTEQDQIRNSIWKFKNGNKSISTSNEVVTVLKHFFTEETLKQLTFLCIPASTIFSNEVRYNIFSSNVCSKTGMTNGFGHIKIKYDKEVKHLTKKEDFNNLDFDRAWFKNRKVIVFDDIFTRGSSINNIVHTLEKLGAIVIGAITLGRTVHSDAGDNPYTIMNKSIKNSDTQIKKLSSEEISAELYKLYHNVTKVALCRKLKEVTIYKHLFSNKTLDANDYITTNEFKRATLCYEIDPETASNELDKFLTTGAKQAFYYIKYNNYLVGTNIQVPKDVASNIAVVEDISNKIDCYKSIDCCLVRGCSDLSINLFNAEYCSDLIALLITIQNEGYDISRLKSIRIFHEKKEKLEKALHIITALFPSLSVSAYKKRIDQINKECKCDALYTINLFPHIYNSGKNQHKIISELLIKSHLIYSQSVFFEYVGNKNNIGILPSDLHNLKSELDNVFSKCHCEHYELEINSKEQYRANFIVYYNKSVENILIGKDIEIVLPDLCPGTPYRTLFNQRQAILLFDTPFKNKLLSSNIDDTIIVKECYDWDDAYSLTHGIKSKKYTLKKAIQEFPQFDISFGLDNNEEWANQVYKFYLEEAQKGNMKCYNNLGVLHNLSSSLPDDIESYNNINLKQNKIIIKYYKLAAEKGDTHAMINLASFYMARNHYKHAIKYYKLASENGEAAGSFSMGIVYQLGLYGYISNTKTAIMYYQKCVEQHHDEIQRDGISNMDINNCYLNLIMLMYNLHYPFKDIDKLYKQIETPSKEIIYAYTVISNNLMNKTNDIFKVMQFNNIEDDEKSYIKFNRICAKYKGIEIKGNIINSDKDSALSQLKELAKTKCSDWPEWEEYIWPKLATWSYYAKEKSSDYIKYWENSIKANPEKECAYKTNIAHALSRIESKKIWKHYAFGNGCKTCHECKNYNKVKRRCPKAEFNWAKNYENNKELASELLKDAALQGYIPALEHLHILKYSTDEASALSSKILLRSGVIPKSYTPYLEKFAKDSVYNDICHMANLGSKAAATLMKEISIIRNEKYEHLYWTAINGNYNELIKIFEKIIGKSFFDGYFNPRTIEEKDYIYNIAHKTVESFTEVNDEEIKFIKAFAEYYIQGKKYYGAKKLYEIARRKGVDVRDLMYKVDVLIRKQEMGYIEGRYENHYRNYTWEDSLMDALDGEMDAYWNID